MVCLDSKDYVQIRNSLIILIKILPHFPVLAKLSQILERKVEKVREEERGQRQDLHVLATSYSGQLKAKTPNMIREADFHHVGDKVHNYSHFIDQVLLVVYLTLSSTQTGKTQDAPNNETSEKVGDGISNKEITNGDTRIEKENKDQREKRTASNQMHQ